MTLIKSHRIKDKIKVRALNLKTVYSIGNRKAQTMKYKRSCNYKNSLDFPHTPHLLGRIELRLFSTNAA